ncbi:hypothetical protein Dsin_014730 [Dipteronia sinensis]|uniref:RNase H type-1 domain-containing protein n=1 Tax=Dipteronia sinensis TaxID=43782 RepID=A0AAE0AN26_9ROSI|nr:hypothetical protein Dsin_014730 [Dipteronia sinensis]
MKDGSQTAVVINGGFVSVVGCGDRVKLWTEVKVDGRRLRDAFPRCQVLAILKDGVIRDFGNWLGTNWVWNIRNRRPLFGWEEDQWKVFSTFLKCIPVRNNCRDTIAWSANSNGLFTLGSFKIALEDASVNEDSIPKLLWRGLCPPKIECGIFRSSLSQLLLVFVDVEVVYGVVGVYYCLNNYVKLWLEAWMGLCPAYKHERAWNSLFCAIVWTIWEVRNQLVFEDIEPNVVKASYVVKFQVVWWFRHLGKGSMDAFQTLLLNVKEFCVDSMKTKKKRILDWNPPAVNHLKFNVDGSILGKPGPTGVGGLLRDFNEKILCLFSFHLGFLDSNAAKIWTVKTALDLCLSIPNLRGRFISIVSDSKVAVSWVNNGDFGSLDHFNLISEIHSNMSSLGDIEVIYESRAFNSFANSLAKIGSNFFRDFVEWRDV